jgi:hypothetical protein
LVIDGTRSLSACDPCASPAPEKNQRYVALILPARNGTTMQLVGGEVTVEQHRERNRTSKRKARARRKSAGHPADPARTEQPAAAAAASAEPDSGPAPEERWH